MYIYFFVLITNYNLLLPASLVIIIIIKLNIIIMKGYLLLTFLVNC